MMFAYIDPGLGQLIWLSIVSAITGLFFYIKKVRAWVVCTFLKIIGRAVKPPVSVDELPMAEKVEAEVHVNADSK
jgi:hypothetical protein